MQQNNLIWIHLIHFDLRIRGIFVYGFEFIWLTLFLVQYFYAIRVLDCLSDFR